MDSAENYNDPKRDVRIDRRFSGNIRCARLLITEDGDFSGFVVAEHIRVAGRFDGSSFSKTFKSSKTSRIFGTIVTERGGLEINPGTEFQARGHTSVLSFDQFAPAGMETDAERLIEKRSQAIVSKLKSAGPVVNPVHDPVSQAVDPMDELKLTEAVSAQHPKEQPEAVPTETAVLPSIF